MRPPRRSVTLLAILITSSVLATPMSASVLAPSSANLRAFASLVHRATVGTFTATYHVTDTLAPSRTGTLVIAQRAAANASPWPDGVGWWSYRFTTVAGALYQWIEHGTSFRACYRRRAGDVVHCGRAGTYEESNDFTEETTPFLAADANLLAHGVAIAGATRRGRTGVVETTSRSSGDARTWCLHVGAGASDAPATLCVNRAGALTSWTGFFSPITGTSAVLVSRSATVSATALTPVRPANVASLLPPF